MPNTNRLTRIGHKDVVLDAAGNTIAKDNGKWRYEYLASGRLFKVYKEKKWVATYVYNSEGLRTRKTTKHGTTVYHYDLAGHLIAETNKNGELQRAYVWLDNLPLAQIDVKGHHDDKGKDKRRNKAKEHIAYLHTDHLGTPRIATDANQAIVWRWESDAFGAKKPDDNDDEYDSNDDNRITVNIRHSNGYADSETGLYYNWNNYYDSRIGRWITPDRMSLAAHFRRWRSRLGTLDQLPFESNPYAYVSNAARQGERSAGA